MKKKQITITEVWKIKRIWIWKRNEEKREISKTDKN